MDLKNAPRAKCDGCRNEFFAVELARFGRQKNSPTFCKACAEQEFERLKNKVTFHQAGKIKGRKEIIE